VDLDGSLRASRADVDLAAVTPPGEVPWFTHRRVGRGWVCVWNVRTFSEDDFKASGEWLLAPRALGLVEVPEPVMNVLRRSLLEPLGLRLEGPAGVGMVAFQDAVCLSNFHPETVRVRLNDRSFEVGPNTCLWRETRRFRREP